jgi:hypothetical protein
VPTGRGSIPGSHASVRQGQRSSNKKKFFFVSLGVVPFIKPQTHRTKGRAEPDRLHHDSIALPTPVPPPLRRRPGTTAAPPAWRHRCDARKASLHRYAAILPPPFRRLPVVCRSPPSAARYASISLSLPTVC